MRSLLLVLLSIDQNSRSSGTAAENASVPTVGLHGLSCPISKGCYKGLKGCYKGLKGLYKGERSRALFGGALHAPPKKINK